MNTDYSLTKQASLIKQELELELAKQGSSLEEFEKVLADINTGEGVYKIAKALNKIIKTAAPATTPPPNTAMVASALRTSVPNETAEALIQRLREKRVNYPLFLEQAKLHDFNTPLGKPGNWLIQKFLKNDGKNVDALVKEIDKHKPQDVYDFILKNPEPFRGVSSGSSPASRAAKTASDGRDDGFLSKIMDRGMSFGGSLPELAFKSSLAGGAIAGLATDEMDKSVESANKALDREREKIKLVRKLTANLRREHGLI